MGCVSVYVQCVAGEKSNKNAGSGREERKRRRGKDAIKKKSARPLPFSYWSVQPMPSAGLGDLYLFSTSLYLFAALLSDVSGCATSVNAPTFDKARRQHSYVPLFSSLPFPSLLFSSLLFSSLLFSSLLFSSSLLCDPLGRYPLGRYHHTLPWVPANPRSSFSPILCISI